MKKFKTQILKFLIALGVGIILYNPIFYGLIWKYGPPFFIPAMFFGHLSDYSVRFVLNKFWGTGTKSTVHLGIEAFSYFVICLLNIGMAVYIQKYAQLTFVKWLILSLVPGFEGKSYLPFLVIQISMIPFTAVLALAQFLIFKRMIKESMA